MCDGNTNLSHIWRANITLKNFKKIDMRCDKRNMNWNINMKFKKLMWNIKCETRNMKYDIRDMKFEIWNVNCEMWIVKCEMWSMKYEIWNFKCEIWHLR